MKFGVVNKSTTVNSIVLHTLQRNITHLAVITRKTNIKLGILKGGGETRKEPKLLEKKTNSTYFIQRSKQSFASLPIQLKDSFAS